MAGNEDLLPEIPDYAPSKASNEDLLPEIPDANNSHPWFGGMRQGMQKNGLQPLYHPNAPMQLIEGINEGGLRSSRAIVGKDTPLSELPKDEWEKEFRQGGRFIGGMAPFSAVAAPVAMTGVAAGLPVAAQYAAMGAGAAATEPGTATERVVAAAENMALLKGGKMAVKAIDKLIATPLSRFLEGGKKPSPEVNVENAQQALIEHKNVQQETSLEDKYKKQKESLEQERDDIEKQKSMLPPKAEMKFLEEPYHLEKKIVSNNEKAEEIDNAINQRLMPHRQHDVRIARNVFNDLDSERKALSEGYNAFDAMYEDGNIKVNKTRSLEEALKDAPELLTPDVLQSSAGIDLARLMELMNTTEQIPVKNWLAGARSARDAGEQFRKKQYTPGVDAEQRLSFGEKAEKFEETYHEMMSKLESVIGPEGKAALEKLNKGWAQRVKPLQRNRIYQEMRFDKATKPNLIHELRKDTRGNDLIRAAIKSNPETLRLAVGQRYFANPEEVLNPNETIQEYLKEAPSLKYLLESKKIVSENAKRLAELKPQVSRKAAGLQQAAFKEGELSTASSDVEKRIAALEENAKKSGISLKTKIQLEAELRNAKKEAKAMKEAKKNRGEAISISDFVPPMYKVPYKGSKYLINKLLGRGK